MHNKPHGWLRLYQGVGEGSQQSQTITKLRALAQSGGVIALFDQGIVSVANFVTNALVARACSKDDFGVFILALSLLYFVRGIQEQLVSATYTIYKHRRSGTELHRYSGSSLVHQIILSAVIMCVLALLGWTLPQFYSSTQLASALRVLLCVTPCFLLREFIRKLSFANFHFGTAVLLDTVSTGVQMVGLVALFVTQTLTPVTVYLVIAFSSGLACAQWCLIRKTPLVLQRSDIAPHWLENWKFGRFALATHIIGCSTPYFMPWFVASLSGEAVTGMYGACQSFVGLANMFVAGVSNFLSPKSAAAFAVGGKDALWNVLMKATAVFLLILGPFALSLLVVGNYLPEQIFGAAYANAMWVVFLLALALVSASLGMTAGNGLWAMDRPSLNMTADLVSLVGTFGVGFFLIPQYEATGAAASVLIGATLSAVARWAILILLLRSHHEPPSSGRSRSEPRHSNQA